MVHVVPEGFDESGSRGERSGEGVSSRGDGGCRVQHGRVPETSIPKFLLTRPQTEETLKSRKRKITTTKI